MPYNLKLNGKDIYIIDGPFGTYNSISEVKKEIERLRKTLNITTVKSKDETGELIDLNKSDDEIAASIEPYTAKACPSCNSSMQEGRCYTKPTLKGFLLHGTSSKDFVFENQINEITTLVKNENTRKAYFCQNCGTTLIPGKK